MSTPADSNKRIVMLGTFGMTPKGTMSARAAGIASALQDRGWHPRIITSPWDNPADAGSRTTFNRIEVINTRQISPWRWPLAVREMIRETTAFQPGLIHLFKPKGFGDLAARYLQRLGYPVIVDMDDWEGSGGWNDLLPYSSVQRRLFDWQERTWPEKADAVTTASRSLKQRAMELGAPGERVCYLPNRLTVRRYRELTDENPKPVHSYPALEREGYRRILLYTRFVEFSPEFVTRVLGNVIHRLSDVRLIVAGTSGDGRAEYALHETAREAGVADRIDSLGWIDPADLGWIARRCSVSLVPFDDTVVNRSKCSVKLLELIACGIPVVASSVGENREFISRLGGGVLARPGDERDHAARLVEILEQSDTEAKLPDTRRVAERTEFCWDGTALEIERLYSGTRSSPPARK